jgi:hypothetical protein
MKCKTKLSAGKQLMNHLKLGKTPKDCNAEYSGYGEAAKPEAGALNWEEIT